MPISHCLLALLIVIIWGCNFIFIKFGLEEVSPLLLCAIRFFLASIPAIFFIKRPASPFKMVILYGMLMFGLQFALLFMGMRAGMTAGLASILAQTQIFFSIFFAVLFLGEAVNGWQIIGALVAFTGIGLVALHLDNHISLLGFILIIAAGASWGLGNLFTKKLSHVNMISLVVWGSFVAAFPLLFLSLIFEGPQRIVYTYHHLTRLGLSSIFYIVYVSTWIGYGGWNWIISRHPISTIVPFTLLVPVVGIVASVLILGEPLQLWKITAGLLVISGLCINLLGARFFMRIKE